MGRITDFTLSVWVTHPSADLSGLPSEFGLGCVREWRAGEPNMPPKGTLLGGYRRNSYCCMRVDVPSDQTLPQTIAMTLHGLSVSQRTIDKIVDTGGRVMVNVGWHSSFNTGEEFESTLLAALGRMKITLGVDVYCDCDEPKPVPLWP